MIELHKNYTPRELEQMYGPNWRTLFNLDFIPYPQKPIINSFEEFDPKTKTIYSQIYDYVLELNPGAVPEVYATGSRVKGYWRTPEEAQELSIKYNRRVKVSDYDYWTPAKNKPTSEQFLNRLGVRVDFNRGDKQVLISK